MSMTLFSHPRMQALQWSAYRFVDQLGLLGKLALVAMGLLVGLFLLNWLPVRQQLSTLNAEAAQNMISQVLPRKSLDPQAALNAYVAQFPKLTQKNSTLNQWMQIAEQNNLILDSVVYKSVHAEKLSPLQATLVDFSLYASYTDIQQFLNQVMTQMPFVALERLSLTKEAADEEVILAHVQLKFYFATSLFVEGRASE